MNLSTIKRFLLENEHINKICASLYRMGGWNKIKKRGNSVVYNNTYLSRCTISISGKNNQIIFNGTNYFKRCKFYITGNNNRIVIGDKVCGYDANFIIEDSNGTIEVGYKTLFTGKIEVACKKVQLLLLDKSVCFLPMLTSETETLIVFWMKTENELTKQRILLSVIMCGLVIE